MWGPPIQALHKIIDGIDQDRGREFARRIDGTYEGHAGNVVSMREEARREAKFGPNMNLDLISQKFYRNVRRSVDATAGDRLTEWQRRAVDVQLKKIESGLQPSDVFPRQQ